jgi:hypothetical protein
LPRITDIGSLVQGLKGYPRTIFNRLFDIREYTGELVLPEGIRNWAGEKFGDPAAVEKQRLVKITNRVTLEGTLFNNLRGMRPLSRAGGKHLGEIIEKQRENCAFCRPREKTTADIFGRLAGNGAVTAANIAKYDRWHGLIIPDEHNPLTFDSGRVAEYFALAGRWFQRVLEQAGAGGEKEPLYPFLMWNCLWPAGSSVVHGHLQVTVTGGMHYPKIEQLRRAGQAYRECFGTNYFGDLCMAHRAVGLVVETGEAWYFPSLTPVKEKETWIIMAGESALARLHRLGRAVGRVLECLRQTGTTSFNVAVYLPPPGPVPEDWEGFPLLARVVDRGDALGRTADFGGMELYAASVVSADPFTLAQRLRDSVTTGV